MFPTMPTRTPSSIRFGTFEVDLPTRTAAAGNPDQTAGPAFRGPGCTARTAWRGGHKGTVAGKVMAGRYVRRFRPRSEQGNQPNQRSSWGHGGYSALYRNSPEKRLSIRCVDRSFSRRHRLTRCPLIYPSAPWRCLLRATFRPLKRWIAARVRGCRFHRQEVSVGP